MAKLEEQLESLLFISHRPISLKEFSRATGAGQAAVKEALVVLEKKYSSDRGGIQLLAADGKYQLATSGRCAEIVEKFIKGETTGELTKPSIETLTIIAYRGPISKTELELIRGVNCSLIIRNLLIRGLILVKEDAKSKSVRYQITLDFLKYLGLNKVDELPDYQKLNQNNNLEKLLTGQENSSVN